MFIKGYKQTEDHKRKILESRRKNGPIKRPDMIVNNPMRKKEIREKVSNSVKESYKNNPLLRSLCAWNKGTRSDNDPYCHIFFNKEWRNIIYKRDSNCQLCGCSKQLSYKLFGRKLIIHHINHNKKDCDLKNCILLCDRCNAHVEKKSLKKFYETKFMIKIYNKYKRTH